LCRYEAQIHSTNAKPIREIFKIYDMLTNFKKYIYIYNINDHTKIYTKSYFCESKFS